jgi:glycosyltransferase involved in cell wall biosynthesis
MLITITAIIPTHNRPDLLKRSIISVLEQTEPVDEIIIVDDTNSVETRNTVNSLNSGNLRYVFNPNQGASASRNLGVNTATSDFVAFLDDDDEWMKDKVKLQKEAILSKNLDACFSQLIINYGDKQIKYNTSARLPNNIRKEICIENFIGGTISAIIRRELFISISGFDIHFPAREEYDLWIRLIQKGAHIDIVEKPLAIAHRSLNKRIRISSNMENYEKAIELLNKKHQRLIDAELTPKQQQLRQRKQYEFLAAQAVSIGLRNKSIRYYLLSLQSKFNIKTLIMLIVAAISPILLIRFRSLIK